MLRSGFGDPSTQPCSSGENIMGKKNRKFVYLFILVLIVLYIAIYVVPKVTGIFETTETLEAGSLQGTEETVCYFVREETVYEAGVSGELAYLIKEGTHIRKGTKAIKLIEKNLSKQEEADEQEKSKYKALTDRLGDRTVRTEDGKVASSGIFSSYVDGYEAFFTPESMETLKYEDVKELDIQAEDVKRNEALAKEPVFKISDNDNWYLMCWVEAASVAKYEIGNEMTVQLPEGAVGVTIKNIIEDGDQWKILFRCNRYYEGFSKSRIEEARIITRDYSGLIAENGSITTRDGKPGVMVRQTSGEYVFTRVKILARDGDYSALQDVSFIDEDGNSVDTVKVYDEILKNPGEGT